MSKKMSSEKKSSQPPKRAKRKPRTKKSTAKADNLSERHPAEVLGRLQDLVKNVDKMKETLTADFAGGGAEQENDRKTLASASADTTGSSGAGSHPIESEQRSDETSEAEKAAQQERQKLFNLCNSMNLYQKAHVLSFLARETVLQDGSTDQILPLMNCDIVIDGITIVVRLPTGEQKEGSNDLIFNPGFDHNNSD